MRFKNVTIAALDYELAPHVITSQDLENRLAPVYDKLHLQPGQLEALTGIRERRFWSSDFKLSDGAINAGRQAIDAGGLEPDAIGMLVYGGVCRENLEPATACAVANGLGLAGDTHLFDLSNACLGVLNGMVLVANAIEMGQIRAGLVVSCESARQIVDLTIERILAASDMQVFKDTLATLTGGSGAVAVLLCDSSLKSEGHRLMGGVIKTAPRHHELCTWGPDTGIPATRPMVMRTDAIGVLNHGVALGIDTFNAFQNELNWPAPLPDKVICHQVGAAHQRTILQSIGIDASKDFSTYPYLGNIGTVSLPITAAIADERGFLQTGDKVAFMGIGSGLNCLILGVQW